MARVSRRSGVETLPKSTKKAAPPKAKKVAGSVPTSGRKVKGYAAQRAETIALAPKKMGGPSHQRELASLAGRVAGKKASEKQQKRIAAGKKANVSKIKQAKTTAEKKAMKSFRGAK